LRFKVDTTGDLSHLEDDLRAQLAVLAAALGALGDPGRKQTDAQRANNGGDEGADSSKYSAFPGWIAQIGFSGVTMVLYI